MNSFRVEERGKSNSWIQNVKTEVHFKSFISYSWLVQTAENYRMNKKHNKMVKMP